MKITEWLAEWSQKLHHNNEKRHVLVTVKGHKLHATGKCSQTYLGPEVFGMSHTEKLYHSHNNDIILSVS